MERLTWKRDLDGYTDVGLRDGVSVGDAISRLADYEDAIPFDRAQELAQAEKGGRLLILPDTKYTDAVTRITGSHDTADATAEKPAL